MDFTLPAKSRSLAIVLALGILLPARLWAGPPFETDDPEPTEFHHFEIYLGATALQVPGIFSGTGPFFAVSYGALPDVQLSLTQQASFSFPGEGPSAYGYGDGQLGLKFRYLHENDSIPQGAFFPSVNFPTGDATKGLGSGQAQFLLPLWFQKSWGPWTSFGGGGYWINPGAGNKNWGFAGWALERDLSPQWTLGGEAFFHSSSAEGQPDGGGFNLGGILNLDAVHHILFSAGRDMIQPSNQFTGYLSFEWTVPAEEK